MWFWSVIITGIITLIDDATTAEEDADDPSAVFIIGRTCCIYKSRDL